MIAFLCAEKGLTPAEAKRLTRWQILMDYFHPRDANGNLIFVGRPDPNPPTDQRGKFFGEWRRLGLADWQIAAAWRRAQAKEKLRQEQAKREQEESLKRAEEWMRNRQQVVTWQTA